MLDKGVKNNGLKATRDEKGTALTSRCWGILVWEEGIQPPPTRQGSKVFRGWRVQLEQEGEASTAAH